MDMSDVAASVNIHKVPSISKSLIVERKQEALDTFQGPSLLFKIYGIKIIGGKKTKFFLRDEIIPAKLYPWDVILIDVREFGPYDKLIIEKGE